MRDLCGKSVGDTPLFCLRDKGHTGMCDPGAEPLPQQPTKRVEEFAPWMTVKQAHRYLHDARFKRAVDMFIPEMMRLLDSAVERR